MLDGLRRQRMCGFHLFSDRAQAFRGQVGRRRRSVRHRGELEGAHRLARRVPPQNPLQILVIWVNVYHAVHFCDVCHDGDLPQTKAKNDGQQIILDHRSYHQSIVQRDPRRSST
uniref:(northern house mosquito) hypothetical protein n=1 Tax=Culex pipiens TaxID=7175 RepID=A0A8D8FZW7_CULPI